MNAGFRLSRFSLSGFIPASGCDPTLSAIGAGGIIGPFRFVIRPGFPAPSRLRTTLKPMTLSLRGHTAEKNLTCGGGGVS